MVACGTFLLSLTSQDMVRKVGLISLSPIDVDFLYRAVHHARDQRAAGSSLGSPGSPCPWNRLEQLHTNDEGGDVCEAGLSDLGPPSLFFVNTFYSVFVFARLSAYSNASKFNEGPYWRRLSLVLTFFSTFCIGSVWNVRVCGGRGLCASRAGLEWCCVCSLLFFLMTAIDGPVYNTLVESGGFVFETDDWLFTFWDFGDCVLDWKDEKERMVFSWSKS